LTARPGPARRALLAAAMLAAALPAGARRATAQPPAGSPLLVAVASSLTLAFPDLAAAFAAATGAPAPRASFGSSVNLARQIAQGAPFALFLSADEESVRWLAARGLLAGPGRVYALGRLALFSPAGSPVEPDPALAGLGRALTAGRMRRFAIANPDLAPYGRAAREALAAAGLWERIRPHLVFGETVAQAAQFALSGNAEGALVAFSLALAPAMARAGRAVPLPARLHAPLRHELALVAAAAPAAALQAAAFRDFLLGAEGRAILAHHGFAAPGAE